MVGLPPSKIWTLPGTDSYNLQAAVESNASELSAVKNELLTIKAKLEATELYSSTMEKELEATE